MNKNCFMLLFSFVLLLGLLSPISATPPPAKIVTGVVSNVVSALLKWLWSLKSTAKPVQHSRSMVKFESGYTVETIFDGSKLGIEPYSIEISPNGEFLVLDSENSNIYKISGPMSRYSRPKLLAGSNEGYIGHIDGRPREARMNHPKGLTVDDRGNIYIADTLNMAIRKISDEGVTTIAGGKWGKVGGHVDGPSEDAKFSNDFDVIYVASTCSLLVVDRGNHAIREIQLNKDDCTTYNDDHHDDEYDNSFPLGIAALICAGFFGFMLALLQRRVRDMFSSNDDPRAPIRPKGTSFPTQQRPPSKSIRQPLIPNEDEFEKHDDEGFFISLGKLIVNSSSSMTEILGSLFSKSKRKPLSYHQYQQQHQQQQQYHYSNNRHSHSNNIASWPMQESFVIPDEDEPPPINNTMESTKTPPSIKNYPFLTNRLEFDNVYYDEQQQQQYHQQQQQQRQQQQHSKMQYNQQKAQVQHQQQKKVQSYYDENCETNEIVFGAVQEHDGRREAMVIKAVDYGDPKYSNHHNNIRPRLNYVGYSHNY